MQASFELFLAASSLHAQVVLQLHDGVNRRDRLNYGVDTEDALPDQPFSSWDHDHLVGSLSYVAPEGSTASPASQLSKYVRAHVSSRAAEGIVFNATLLSHALHSSSYLLSTPLLMGHQAMLLWTPRKPETVALSLHPLSAASVLPSASSGQGKRSCAIPASFKSVSQQPNF